MQIGVPGAAPPREIALLSLGCLPSLAAWPSASTAAARSGSWCARLETRLLRLQGTTLDIPAPSLLGDTDRSRSVPSLEDSTLQTLLEFHPSPATLATLATTGVTIELSRPCWPAAPAVPQLTVCLCVRGLTTGSHSLLLDHGPPRRPRRLDPSPVWHV